ncbi:glycoside hydrolase family 71/99-like protein [Chryseobacterium sp. Ch-15]|uniref:Glycoside hydrolase family 71/99-like protein n=1 Tax=Chryseobacterium muglaense TaxID=2893752 RepID=A0A9Q3YSW0_9FLAO|nr:glycoside hydrolase family 71/99-like protein [Chryseobacterium muglaense]MBD3905441.1 xylosidase [Chryseobacterium muglaense]MCC9036486.1 glycoside hydrolase family 71/99-like protein [Chryseobacterium muglaense]MCM2555411.1 glycoside hydrolase family 71/99-like protein [Chryseobacterium muglaense]
MTGYQGWFTTEGDSAKLGWNRYAKDWVFTNKVCSFDAWPETREYEKLYKTPIVDSKGSSTFLFSSNDASTSDLHMKWMKDFSIDGAFVQRFFLALHDATRDHHLKVLKNMMKSGKKYNRSVSVMYDISGLKTDKDAEKIINDWKYLVDELKITSQNDTSYLFHEHKPIVGIIIAGLKDSPSNLQAIKKIIYFFKTDKNYGNCSIVLGVPFYWRTLNNDSTSDILLHDLVKICNYIMPWSVGRIRYDNLSEVLNIMEDDKKWCDKYKVEYLPVIYPGFSWHNAVSGAPLNEIPRNNGELYKKQIKMVETIKSNNVFAAMFDEINEGTAVFKLSKKPPNTSEMKFIPYESEISEDYYLQLLQKLSENLKR